MTKRTIDPAYLAFPTIKYSRNRWWLRVISFVIKAMRFNYSWAENIETRKHRIKGVGGNSIPVIEIAYSSVGDNAPAIVYLHGGAFFLTYAGMHLDNAQLYAQVGQCRWMSGGLLYAYNSGSQ